MEVSSQNFVELPTFDQGFPVGRNPENPNDIAHKETDGPKMTMYYNKDKTRRIFDFRLDSGNRVITLDVGGDDKGWVPLVNLNVNQPPWTKDEPQYKLRVSFFDYTGGRTHVARIAVKPEGDKIPRTESIHGDHDIMKRLLESGVYTPDQVPDKFDFEKTVNLLITQFSNGDTSTPKLVAAKY